MKRKILIVLAFLMLFSLLLTSCKDDTVSPTSTSVGTKTFAEGDMFAERALISDDLPEKNYNGRSFRIVTTHPYEVIDGAGNTGELIPDARFSRNTTVENRFGVKIDIVYQGELGEVNTYVTKTVMSSVDEFDLLVAHLSTAGNLVMKNLFVNWYDIPHINFDKPWWADSNKDLLTYDGKAIIAISDFNFESIGCIYTMYFNKNLASSYELGNLYQLALDGEWTYDVFYDMIRDVWVDDGDGKPSAEDFYGFVQDYHQGINQWIWAFDNPIMKKDADGVPQISLKTDKINDITQKIYDLVYNTTGVYYSQGWSDWSMKKFLDKQTIFAIARIDLVIKPDLRNFTDEYGLLPVPKYDKNQKNYSTMAYAQHSVLTVPKTAKDLEFVGIITEALSAESYKQVMPAFYEIALKTRYLRDDESKLVLDMILDSRVYDFGYIYGGGDGALSWFFSNMIMAKKNNFESYYQSKIVAGRNYYKKVLKIFDKLG